MEQPTRVTVTRAVAAPRLNLLLEETGVAAFTIEVQIERAEPFVVDAHDEGRARVPSPPRLARRTPALL